MTRKLNESNYTTGSGRSNRAATRTIQSMQMLMGKQLVEMIHLELAVLAPHHAAYVHVLFRHDAGQVLDIQLGPENAAIQTKYPGLVL